MEEDLQCIELINTNSADAVLCGDDFTAQSEVDVCCKIVDVLVNGESQGITNDGTSEIITLYNILEPKLIQFVYEPRQFAVEVLSGIGGSHNIIVDDENVVTNGKNDEIILKCGQNMQTECIADDCYVLDYSITSLTTEASLNGCNYNWFKTSLL